MARKENRPPPPGSSSMYRSQTQHQTRPHTHSPPRSSPEPSPPRTPPSQLARTGRGKGADAAVTGAYRSRNLARDLPAEDARDVDGDSSRERSNSHDLNWSPDHQRVSVVDNMLLSLDQFPSTSLSFFPSQSSNTYGDASNSQFYANDSHPPEHNYHEPPSGRLHGHNQSSSVNSDFSFHPEPPPVTQTRGHRSNSSGNYQSTLGRIDSVRLADEGKSQQEQIPERTQAGPASGKGAGHSTRGRKLSKGSGSSSFDLGHTSSQRWQPQVGDRRSTSFDQGISRPDFVSQITRATSTYSKQQAMFYDSLDAAPTPTVPVGPRRGVSPSGSVGYRPASSLSANQKAANVRRRGSIKSPLALFNRQEQDEMDTSHGNAGRQATMHQRSGSGGPPDASISKSMAHNYDSPIASTPNLPIVGKENQRPGFFKRVFGSRPSQQSIETSPLQTRTERANQNNTKEANHHPSPPLHPPPPPPTRLPKSATAPAGKELRGQSIAGKEPPAHPLNKKTSFFRRRKKSLSSPAPLPTPPLQLQAQWPNQDPPPPQDEEQSPVSSLRQVMNPYLNTTSRSLNQEINHHFSAADLEAIKSTESELFGKSTIRTVPDSNENEAALLSSTNGQNVIAHIIETNAKPSSTRGSPSSPATPRTLKNLTKAERSQLSVDTRAQTPPGSANTTPRDENGQPISATSQPMSATSRPKSAGSYRQRAGSHGQRQSDADKALQYLPGSTPTFKTRSPASLAREAAKGLPDSNALEAPVARVEAKPGLKSNGDRNPGLWLQPSVSDDNFVDAKVAQTPTDKGPEEVPRTSASTTGDYRTPTEANKPAGPSHATVVDGPVVGVSETDAMVPTEEDRLLAEKLFRGDSEINRLNTAAWLGEAGPDRGRVRKAYMELFDWQCVSILSALRSFCSQLKVKGETQQVDRLLDALSTRWCQSNPNHGFKANDVVHTICYSILLLNTDLHMADIESKMTRGQFIKNTLPTIRRVVADAAPNAFDSTRGSMLPPPRRQESKEDAVTAFETAPGQEPRRPVNQLAARPSDYSGSDLGSSMPQTPLDEAEDCGPLVSAPFQGKMGAWELQVEAVLKNFYISIRNERLPLFGSDQLKAPEPHPSSTSLSAMTGNMLRRTNSVLSKANSESIPGRGRMMENRTGSRWSSKNRSRPRLYPSSLAQSSRTSFDDDASAISPSASSMWSKYSLGKTQTSMSVNSVASGFPNGDYQQSIGFANALSQAIIREEAAPDGPEETMRVGPLLEDESLELAGSPWAKEGILKHKHHLEAVDKRARDRNWTECFAVIEKGWMRLFQFNVNARSMRAKARNQRMPGGVVGGGNWTENAEPIGSYLLRQSIASALPPPGYSKARPHVWALSLPNGAVHLFQAGTPEIVKEYVSSANYWSARMSKEPLVGGISNIEYGWSENVINAALIIPSTATTPGDERASLALSASRPSFQTSIRSSIDHGASNSSRARLPGDRFMINDWTPPPQSMLPSQLLEVDQLRALSTYVKNVEDELRRHNELRGPMLLAFTPRHPNHVKAMQNWERKSSYLLREIVKFSTYIDCLQGAQVTKAKVYAERQEREKEREERDREAGKALKAGREAGFV